MKPPAWMSIPIFSLIVPQVLLEIINQPGCGLVKVVGRIINGNNTERTKMPWIVYMVMDIEDRPGHFKSQVCGGSIISPSFIITAAHCVVYSLDHPDDVRVKYNATWADEGPRGYVKKIIVHPGFKITTLQNDVALLKLSKPLVFDEFVKPVCLPAKNMWLANHAVLAAGWGHVDEAHGKAVRLQYIKTKVLPYRHCPHRFNNSRHTFNRSEMICTDANAMGTCLGDSGGPVTAWQQVNKATRFVLVGLVSFAYGCSGNGSFNIHTRVSHFVKWINTTIIKETNQKACSGEAMCM